jgi:TolA-binding protein
MTRTFTFPIVVTVLLGLSSLAFAQDAPSESDYVVRINRLETQIRQLSGQVEELQFANKRLEESLKKFEQDVEMRFQDVKGQPALSQKSGAAESSSAPLNLAATSKTGAAATQTTGTLAAQAANAKQSPAQPAKPADAKSALAEARAAFAAGNFDEAAQSARDLIQTAL